MKKNIRTSRKTAIRKRLPASVRLHYDAIQALAANKLAGLGIALLFAGLVALLVTTAGFGAFGSNLDTVEIADAQTPIEHHFPIIFTRQTGMLITAEATNTITDWKNRMIGPSDRCGSATFAVTPNNPSVNHSNRFAINSEYLDGYRNRFVCFQATDANGRQGWGLQAIDLGNPVITIENISGSLDDNYKLLLQARSNEIVNWRVFLFQRVQLGAVETGTLNGDCRRAVAGGDGLRERAGALKLIAQEQDTSRLLVHYAAAELAAFPRLCLEATDHSDNRTYKEVILREEIWPPDPNWLINPYRVSYQLRDLECGAPAVGYSEEELRTASNPELRRAVYCISFEDGLAKWQNVRPQAQVLHGNNGEGYRVISGPIDRPVILVDDSYCISTHDSRMVGQDCPLTERLKRTCTAWSGYPNVDPLWHCLSADDPAEFLNQTLILSDREGIFRPLSEVRVVDCSKRDLRVITQRDSFDCSAAIRPAEDPYMEP